MQNNSKWISVWMESEYLPNCFSFQLRLCGSNNRNIKFFFSGWCWGQNSWYYLHFKMYVLRGRFLTMLFKQEKQGKCPSVYNLLHFLPVGWVWQIVCACLSASGGVRPGKKGQGRARPFPTAIGGIAVLPIPTIVWWEKAELWKLLDQVQYQYIY